MWSKQRRLKEVEINQPPWIQYKSSVSQWHSKQPFQSIAKEDEGKIITIKASRHMNYEIWLLKRSRSEEAKVTKICRIGPFGLLEARNNDIWSWKICVFESFMETQGSSSANQNLDVIVPETQQGPVVFHERGRKTLEWIFGNQRVGSPPLPGPEPGNQGPEHTRLPGTQAGWARSILRRTYVCANI